jgi:EAL domain-containing protein (putative c-di-GMP-specific phosphodiesterase class I)
MTPTEEERLRDALGEAIRGNQLGLHFQGRVNLRTRRVVCGEALSRWRHPRRGMVPATVFIPVAERHGLIGQLGGWALSRACSEAARWPGDVGVSVNASAAQLNEGGLLDQIHAALGESGLPPDRLEIELTETGVVKADTETRRTLSAIRDLGVGLALDDFGTGYATLSALKRLPLTVLKLDRSLVRGFLRHAEDTAVARAAISTGQALGLTIVAEGIADEAQCRFLAELGCDQGQSFFLGRPMTPERFRASLREGDPTLG